MEKFELSTDEYAARNDTVLAYKQRHKLGRFADETESQHEEDFPSLPPGIAIGQRCEVEGGRRGTIRFVGKTEFGTGRGVWVGVQYDEPVGKSDGTCVSFIYPFREPLKSCPPSAFSIESKRYFECPPKFGGFVRPEKIDIGDLPPIDLDAELDEM